MSKAIQNIILIAGVLLAVDACHSKPSAAPQETKSVAPTAVTNPAPAAPEAPPPAPPQAPKPAGPDGSWTGSSGTSADDLPLNFTVKGNQVSQVYASYRAKVGSCSAFASFSSDAVAAINGKAFTIQGKYEKIQFTMNGTFTSDKEASGTLHWTGNSGICGDIDTQANWTAKKGSESEDSPDSVDEN